MDHKAFLVGLSAEQRVALTGRTDAAGLRRLLPHAGLIVFLGGWIAAGMAFWWLLMLPQGILLAFLFTLQHEAIHKTPFANEQLNEWVGRVTGLLIVQPFQWFRYFHLAHHRHTNDPVRDPELAVVKPKSWLGLTWYLSTVPYWRAKLALLWRNAIGIFDADYLPERTHGRLRRESRILLLIYAAAILFSFTVSTTLIWAWLLPLVIGFPFLRLYLLAEHGRCPFVADMFDNTRTTYTNLAMRLLAWNMPFHTEHHVYPQVPFHKLPELHRLTKPHLRHTEPGYGAFVRRYVATLPD